MEQYNALAVAVGSAMKDLVEDRIERGVALRKLLCANEQQPTAPCCSVEDSHIPETGMSRKHLKSEGVNEPRSNDLNPVVQS